MTTLLFVLLFTLIHFTQSSLNATPLVSSLPTMESFRVLLTGTGPEDMVIDSMRKPSRLLISCSSRRPEYTAYGEIESVNPGNGKRAPMIRVGEPAGLTFRPHGISLVQAGEIQYLYVITHDDMRGIHPIIKYSVDGDSLVFVQLLTSRLLVSPNALQAFPNGSLLVCNDAAVRNSMKEKIFMMKRGNVLYYDGLGNWNVVADKLGMPAGLAGMGNRIFVSATLENKLYSFQLIDGQLKDKAQVCRIKGPDNIRISQDNLIITSHPKPIQFIRHVKNKSHKSPSLVLAVDPRTGNSNRLFYDSGKRISAASVALLFNSQLVIGQIFEPFIGLSDLK